MKYKYTKEQIQAAVEGSYSIAQSLTKLGVLSVGGNYRIIKKYIKLYDINTSHFTGMLWNKGKIFGPKRPIEDYLNNEFPISSHKLKLRILSEKLKENICENCKNAKWLGSAIPLELHHIDGNYENNNLSNIQFLCPNCHAMTNNYRGKAKKKKENGGPEES